MEEGFMRLHKFLAQQGVASRRKVEEMMRGGRVAVNDAIVSLPGTRIQPGVDRVSVDGRPVAAQSAARRTIMLNKPRGYVCSKSQVEGRTVYDLLRDVEERLVPVGRLDKNTEGLLLLSSDGDLVLRLTHPRFEKEKEYRVTVSGPVSDQQLRTLQSPLLMDGYRTRPAAVCICGPGTKTSRWILNFVLKEGRKRQIRALCEEARLEIHRLVRVRVGRLTMGNLRPGQWRDLTAAELVALR